MGICGCIMERCNDGCDDMPCETGYVSANIPRIGSTTSTANRFSPSISDRPLDQGVFATFETDIVPPLLPDLPADSWAKAVTRSGVIGTTKPRHLTVFRRWGRRTRNACSRDNHGRIWRRPLG